MPSWQISARVFPALATDLNFVSAVLIGLADCRSLALLFQCGPFSNRLPSPSPHQYSDSSFNLTAASIERCKENQKKLFCFCIDK